MNNDTLVSSLEELAADISTHGMAPLLETLLNGLMTFERQRHLRAEPYERTEVRTGYANGHKERVFHSSVGPLNLRVPQVREGDFYPGCLERGLRSDRALKAVVAEMYIKGISTRKVADVTRELCGLEVSASQVSRLTAELDQGLEAFRSRRLGAFRYLLVDARYEKVRLDGHIVDVAVLIAVGITPEGHREVIGCSISLSEAEVHWRSFLESLVTRGLHGLELIVSDDHAGLRCARRAVFPAVPWQRCQFHFVQNAQAYARRRETRLALANAVKGIFACSTVEAARAEVKRVVAGFSRSQSQFAAWLEEHVEECFVCYSAPDRWRRKLRTTNGLERLNQEIKRRTRVCRMFPNEASCLRLVTAIVQEVHEDWVTSGRAYLGGAETLARPSGEADV
jgi:putative transposase